MASFQATVRMPPKAVFDFVIDPTIWEECTPWKVRGPEGALEVGSRWTERRLWHRLHWEVTAYDRRGMQYTCRVDGVDVTVACKKGGTMSCNLQVRIEGDGRKAARLERLLHERAMRFAKWAEGG